jgi:hypothetical protein
MNYIEINTTAYSEENFIIATDLTKEDIELVLLPYLKEARDLDVDYMNEDIVDLLVERYPLNFIEWVETEYLEL